MLELSQFERNVTSQNGEDGVLAEVFRRIGAITNSCIEFGAWDGKHLSNTWTYWAEQGWKSLLIEGDPVKFEDLKSSTSGFPNVIAACRFVRNSGPDTLDQIAKEVNFPLCPDLLSIDIDSDDLSVFESLNVLKPRVVVIEYNPTIPPFMEFQQSPGENLGASARSICAFAAAGGFRLCHITRTNLIFVTSEEFPNLGIQEPSLLLDFPVDHLSFVIIGYSGETYVTRGRLPYHPSQLRGSWWPHLRILARQFRSWITRRCRLSTRSDGLIPVDVTMRIDH